jgi:hypothetical protein
MVRRVLIIALSLLGLTLVTLLVASFFTEPEWEISSDGRGYLGVSVYDGRLRFCRWDLTGDMTWRRIIELDQARHPRYKIDPDKVLSYLQSERTPASNDDDVPDLGVERLPPKQLTDADESQYLWDVFIGNLPLPEPHFNTGADTWGTAGKQGTEPAWQASYSYIILPLWLLPWPLLVYPAIVATRRLRQRHRPERQTTTPDSPV